MATYINDLRLKEISTGDESGTWGTSTNTNLELIGEALGYATQEVFGSDADATTTVADGASDPARAMYFKITSAGSLTATRTCTIAPNTVSRVMFIENATTGSQSIAISQGSGANVTIAAGKTAVVYLDGAGSGAAVVDAMAGVDPGVTDTLAEVLTAGNTTGGTNIELSTTDKVQFRDTGIYINSSVDGQLDIVADTEIQIAATTIDIDGAVDMASTLQVDGAITSSAGATITVADNSDVLTLVSTDADANQGPVLNLFRNSGSPADSDVLAQVLFSGENDNNEEIEYSRLQGFIADASDGTETGGLNLQGMLAGTLRSRFKTNATELVINDDSVDLDFRVESDGASHMLFVDASTNRVGIGEASPDTPLHLTTSSSGTAVTIESTDGSSAAGSTVILYKNSASPLAGDGLSTIKFRGNDSGGATNDYVQLVATLEDPTATAEDGRFTIQALTNGANKNRLSVNSTELNINESGQDLNFRVESDSNDHMLFVDGGANRIGVGTSGPLEILHGHNGSGDDGTYLRLSGGGSLNESYGGWMRGYGVSGNGGFLELGVVDAGTKKTAMQVTAQGNNLKFYTAAVERLQFDYLGNTVFNESGVNSDFRVESDSQTHMLFVDASTNRIGIQTSAPDAEVHISGTSPHIDLGPQGSNRAKIGYASTNLYLGTTSGGGEVIIKNNISSTDAPESSGDEIARFGDTIVFNEGSRDQDFRVESDNNANMLFVDGGNDRVAVKLITAEPINTLDVNGDISFTRTVSKKVSTGSGNSNYFVIYEKDFETSAFTTNQHWVRITGAGATDGAYGSAEFYITFKQQTSSKYFNIVPIENTGLTIGYTYDASGGASSAGQLKIFASGAHYTYIQVFATARDGNSDDDLNRGTFPMTDTGSASAPAGMTTMAFPLNYGANKYTLSGYASNQYVINEGSNDLDFRVESDSNTHAIYMNAANGTTSFGSSTPQTAYNFIGVGGIYIGNGNQPSGDFMSIDAEGGAGATKMTFYRYDSSATTYQDRFSIAGETSETVVNDSGLDIDFRVESDGNANALFVDASAGTVAINTATLTHNGNTAGSLIVNGGSTGSTSPIMMVIDGDGSVEGDSVLLECSFVNDDVFSSARYVQFRDSGGTQGSISGTGDGTVAYNTSSDERLKQNIQDTDSKWDLVKSLQVRDYEWKKSGKQDTGFIAQELHDKWAKPVKVGGEDVTNDPWSVDYGQLTPILTKALQEAMEKIESLEARITALES